MLRKQPISWQMSLAVAAVAIEFCVSANFLTWAGVPYVVEGGALPAKIHPGTYLLCLAFAILVARQERPSRAVWSLFGNDRKIAVYLGCLFSSLVYSLLTTGAANVVVLLDTFLPAGLLAAVLQDASAQEIQILRNVFQCGVCLNSVIALGEAASRATLVPPYLNEVEYHAVDGEFRPTALYDHPLTAGVMTLMGIALAPASFWRRIIYLALSTAALVAFGGRVAVAAAIVTAMTSASVAFCSRVLRRDREAFRLLACSGFLILGFAVTAAIAFEVGISVRLTGHLYWDPSAQVRLAQWNVLGELNDWQIFFGTRREEMLQILTVLWLRSGVEVIENFWLLMFIGLGVVGFPIFVTGFLILLSWCWQLSGLQGRLLVLTFVVVVSTSNSLGRKSTLLVGLVAAIASLPEWRSIKSEMSVRQIRHFGPRDFVPIER